MEDLADSEPKSSKFWDLLDDLEARGAAG